ncbi:MAG: ATP-dependent Zn protease [Synechococcales cyanobacterium M58_A2018_015]|nr:ATP-dependent Zn protease [Synechococcales cyanobacterium M58_A2018_015]
MSQTTLNLVAVTIFTFVMTSLLGPLFHLSPFVPALAAGGLLGAATLDRFSFQGQMGDLVVDWFARFSPDYRARVLHHEAGHFLVAHLLGIPVTGYTLSAWQAFRQGQPGRGGVQFATEALNAELNQGQLPIPLIDRYCTVWMAGMAAETLVYGNAEGGADDRQKLRWLWHHLRRPDSEGALKERWATLQAKSLLQTHWLAYESLVEAMAQQRSVDACRLLLEQQVAQSGETA